MATNQVTSAAIDVVRILEPLEPADRLRVVDAALTLLGEPAPSRPTASGGGETSEKEGDERGRFFEHIDHGRPSDNLRAVAAWHFHEYGSAPFMLAEIKALADEIGLTIPARIDMSLKTARHEGRSLFKQHGRGRYAPTVHGENFFRNHYRARKGNKAKPLTDGSEA